MESGCAKTVLFACCLAGIVILASNAATRKRTSHLRNTGLANFSKPSEIFRIIPKSGKMVTQKFVEQEALDMAKGLDDCCLAFDVPRRDPKSSIFEFYWLHG
tara:strand:- start:947 stop:1252 length:306 start_codon:yes stop_codon:yes gene_type:complete